MAKTKSKPNDTATAATAEICTPPTWFRVARWACFAATVGIAVGMLALLTAQLSGIQTTYTGPEPLYRGRAIQIQYCMFSSSTYASQESRCQFSYAVASVSLVLSFIWSYMQTLRRNPFKHPKAKLVDLVVTGIWLLLWLATAIVLCVWADAANNAGSFLKPAANARNGLCVMAWLEFLLVALLTASAGLLFTKKCQSVFNKWEDKAKERKFAHEQKRLESHQAKVADAEGRALAAKQASQATGMKAPAAEHSARVYAPAAVGAPGVQDGGAGKALPVSSKGAAAAEDNPFRG